MLAPRTVCSMRWSSVDRCSQKAATRSIAAPMTARGADTSGRCPFESVESQLEPTRIRSILRSPRHRDATAVKALQAGAEHRAVDLAQQAAGDVDDTLGVDAEQVAVEREVMDGAQRN